MRQIVAIVFLSFAAVFASYADDDVQKDIFDSYLKQAAGGDAVAQYVVAQRYENGRGTQKNLERAYYWYGMAAKQNYPLAVIKIEERQKEQEKTEPASPVKSEKADPVPAAKTIPPKNESGKKPVPLHGETAAKPKSKPVKTPAAPVIATRSAKVQPEVQAARTESAKPESKPLPKEIIAKAPMAAEPPPPLINVMQTLLNGKWKRNHQEAELLPSAHAACLQSSATEVVCFSGELTRNVDNNGLTYTVKSVISGINNKEARFNLHYVYNVMDIAGRPYSPPSGISSEADDMALKTGWQEPGVSMDCHLRDEYSLTCTRADRKMTYQYMRE